MFLVTCLRPLYFPVWPSGSIPRCKTKVKRTKCNLLWNPSCNSAPSIPIHKCNMSSVSSLHIWFVFFPLSCAYLQLQFLQLRTICITLLVHPKFKKPWRTGLGNIWRCLSQNGRFQIFPHLSRSWTWHQKALVPSFPAAPLLLFVLWGNGEDLYHLLA